MPCGELWETAMCNYFLHEMTEEHLTNAIENTHYLLDLAREKAEAAKAGIAEGTKRLSQLNRETMRRDTLAKERRRCTVAVYGSYESLVARVEQAKRDKTLYQSRIADLERQLYVAESKLYSIRSALSEG